MKCCLICLRVGENSKGGNTCIRKSACFWCSCTDLLLQLRLDGSASLCLGCNLPLFLRRGQVCLSWQFLEGLHSFLYPAAKIYRNLSCSPDKTKHDHVNREGLQCPEELRWLRMLNNFLELGTLLLTCLAAVARVAMG